MGWVTVALYGGVKYWLEVDTKSTLPINKLQEVFYGEWQTKFFVGSACVKMLFQEVLQATVMLDETLKYINAQAGKQF